MTDFSEMSLAEISATIAAATGGALVGQGRAYGPKKNRSRYYGLPGGARLRISDHGHGSDRFAADVADIEVVFDGDTASISAYDVKNFTRGKELFYISLERDTPQDDVFDASWQRGFGGDGAAWSAAIIEQVRALVEMVNTKQQVANETDRT